MATSWQLRGLRGCYGVYVVVFLTKITLHVRGSYGTAIREGVTVALSSIVGEIRAWFPIGIFDPHSGHSVSVGPIRV